MTHDAPSPRRRVGTAALLSVVPLVFAVIAEAAWIAVIAGLVQEFALREPTIGIPALAAIVLTGVVTARLLAGRLGRRWPPVALAIAVLAGAAGWLGSPEARAAIASGHLDRALASHPGGWLATVAIVRGFAHARLPLAEATLGRLLAAGIPGLAIVAILGGMIAEPWRGRFLSDALVAAIVFLTSATMGVAVARMTAVGADSGFDWRRNHAWFGLLVMAVVVAAAIAISSSSIVAPGIGALVGLMLGALFVPIVVIGFVAGFGRRTIRVLALFAAGAVALASILTIIGAAGPLPRIGSVFGTGVAASETPPAVGAIGGSVLLVAALVLILILVRLWMRRPAVEDGDVVETRTIDRGEAISGRSRLRRRRPPAPVDAVTAYLRLVEDLADRPAVRRQPSETPSEHARRLRATGRAGLSMDLLAADYALARYAELGLSAAENRRAVARWRTLRRWLGDRPR